MEGTILHFRQNRHTTSGNHLLIEVPGIKNRAEAEKLVGKKVTYNTGKKDITGKVASPHGNKGMIRVIFDTGMPGQSLGKKVVLA